MFKPSSLLLAAVALVAASSLAFTPSGSASPSSEAKATHTLTLDYQQQRGDLRRAMLRIAPNDREVRPLWRGPLHSISVLTTDKRWIIIESFLSSGHSTGHHAEARVMLPAPGDISAILVRPVRGPSFGWKVEEGESYTEVEWTYFSQNGRQTATPNSEEDPKDDPEEPEDPDEPEDPEDEGCSGADSCTGIIDPWTCECQEDIRDPWGEESNGTQVVLSI